MNCVDQAKNAKSKKPISHSAIVGLSIRLLIARHTFRSNSNELYLAKRNRRQPMTCPIFQTPVKTKGLSNPPQATNSGVDEYAIMATDMRDMAAVFRDNRSVSLSTIVLRILFRRILWKFLRRKWTSFDILTASLKKLNRCNSSNPSQKTFEALTDYMLELSYSI